MKDLFLFLLILSIAFGKYSYFDKCYRFADSSSSRRQIYSQYYVNRKGIPLSHDIINFEYSQEEHFLAVQYYYHYVLTDCVWKDDNYNCTATVESVWFKIANATAAQTFITTCDPVFYKKYGDITKHKCDIEGYDPFEYLYMVIGTSSPKVIPMKDGVPQPTGQPDGECVWEYEILGLWSLVAVIVLICCIIVAIIAIGVIWFIAQKHRSNKRKRLNSALIHNKEPDV